MSKTQNKSIEPDYKNNTYLVKRLFRIYIAPHKFSFLLSILLMIVIAGTTAGQAYLVKPALDEVFVKKSTAVLALIPIIVIIVSVAKASSTYFQMLITSYINIYITANLRKDLYSHFIYSDISDTNRSSSGEKIQKIIMDISLIASGINMALNNAIKQYLTLFALVVVMFYQNLELALIAFIGFPTALYPVYRVGKKMRHLSFGDQQNESKICITNG